MIEILIALSITAIIMSFIVGVVINMIQQRNEIESTSKSQIIGPGILRLITQDLEATFIYQLDELKKKAAENEAEEAEGGNGELPGGNPPRNNNNNEDNETGNIYEEMKVNYFIGEDQGSEENAQNTLHFVTSLDSKLRIGNKQSDICEVGYYLVKNDNNKYRDDLYILYRREDFFLDKEPTEGGKAIKIYDRVKALEFKYYVKPENESEYDDLYEGTAEPEDEWDNTEDGGLPYAVEIIIWIDLSNDKQVQQDEENVKVHKYRTLVMLPAYATRKQLSEDEDE